MSEYQYYEFLAIDTPLTAEQQRELRSITSRATITSTRLVNEYHYGDFRGDPLELLEKYFDAHLYYANWGTRALMFGFPRHLVDLDTLSEYSDDEYCRVTERGGRVIVELWEPDSEGDWDYHEEPELASLIPLRDDILAGDLRSLYLAALKGLGVWIEEYDLDEEEMDEANLEPPVPAGLGSLNAPLNALIDLLDVDRDLAAAAAEGSPSLRSIDPSDREIEEWIRSMPEREKEALLIRLVRGDINIAGEILRRFRTEKIGSLAPQRERSRRQVAELYGRAERLREERLQVEAKQREAEAARHREELARARAEYLAGLRGQEPSLWRQAEELARSKQAVKYDHAVTVLTDLRDLAKENGQPDEFQSQLFAFRHAHSGKPALLKRLDKAGLR